MAGEVFAGLLVAALCFGSAPASAAGIGGPATGRGAEPMQLAQSNSTTSAPIPQGVGPRTAAPETAQRAPAEVKGQLIPFEIFINGARVGDWVLLDLNGVLHAPIDAFEEWRVTRRSEVQAVVYRGQIWFPLWSVPGYEARLNPANQSLDLKFSPNAFATTHLTRDFAGRPPVTRPLTSVFLNYDLSYTQSDFNHGELTTRDLGALTELGISGSLGVLTSSQVGRNLKDDPTLGSRDWIRLETTFNRDFPDDNVTLRIGDSTTRPGIWGRALYFGGVQLARNFALSPGFVTQPIPSLTGTATTPSTVELYINDALRQTSQVPSGPFTIDNFPLLTGTGQAQLVVRDILGRETTLVQSFFTSSNLLREGLSDWSAEAGAVRNNFGVENADYGERFGSGLFRYGVNNGLTFETRGEASGRTYGAGVGLTAALPVQVLGQIAVAGSRDDTNGTGGLYQLGAEYASLRNGFTARTEGVTSDFRRVGQFEATPSYKRQTLFSYTYFTRQFGQFGLGFARSESFSTALSVSTYSANYTILVAERASLTVSATRVDSQNGANAVGVSVLIPLEGRINATGSVTRRSGGGSDFHVGASKSITAETGEGWRALAGRRGDVRYAEGGGYYQGSYGFASLDAMASEIQSTARLGAQGGLIFVDGKAFASRRLLDSFALVEVPGYANVGVGFQSAVLTRTDSDGKALVPRLLPYRQNSIRLDPNELPISAEIDNIEMTTVPPARSAVKVTFPVRSGRGALIKILLDDGQPAPAGAELELVGDSKEFFVARRGEAFVTGLQARNVLRLKWNKQSCTLNVELPEGDKDEIARVGPVTCSGVKR
jgi:outer membrane usher protein